MLALRTNKDRVLFVPLPRLTFLFWLSRMANELKEELYERCTMKRKSKQNWFGRGKSGMKKMRGWRAKQFLIVTVSHITADGFWLHNEGTSFYISRKHYPWFIGATDKEIRDVCKLHSPDMNALYDTGLYWDTLDFGLPMCRFYRPDTLQVYGVYVRNEQREDLYEQHVQWLKENNLPVPKRKVTA